MRRPRGWTNFAGQAGLFALLGGLYALTGLYGRHEASTAIANGSSVIHVERELGIGWEHTLQGWALQHDAVRQFANRTYMLSQFTITNCFLIWAYLRRYGAYLRIRNALVVANAFALIGALAFPLAPPRLIPGSGIVDTLGSGPATFHSTLVDALNNPYAAFPSLHASYALVLGVAGVALTRRPWLRAIWIIYPALVVFSVVATGNHFLIDVLAGAVAVLATPAVERAIAAAGVHLRSGRRMATAFAGGRAERSLS